MTLQIGDISDGRVNEPADIASSAEGEDGGPPARKDPILKEEALYGLAGDVVRTIGPHSEADPAAVLASFLAAAGAMLGQAGHSFAGDEEHPARVWPLIIGPTAGGMKGTSWSAVRRVVLTADPSFGDKFKSGLSSGEGLIEAVRDGVGEPNDKNFDEGVTDKRLLVVESEFAAVLAKSNREGNALSMTLRQAWDGGTLATMTRKNSALKATDPHLVIVGHITATELRIKLSESDVAGGLMNRFLPVLSRRSKRLPSGGGTPEQEITGLASTLRAVLRGGSKSVRLRRAPEAEQLWADRYEALTPDDLPDSHYASVIARAVPQVIRLSTTYALLDKSHLVEVAHLQAALAFWDYVCASAFTVFGDVAAHTDLDKIMTAIDVAGKRGLSRSDASAVFSRNKPKPQLDELLKQLTRTGRYEEVPQRPSGRGRPSWFYRRTHE
jgi:hypothetical protein